MDALLRAVSMYVFLLIVFRVVGRRTMSEMTNFDFILLLIIGEATQQGLLGEDFSVTNAFLVVLTLVAMDVMLSLLKQRFPWIQKHLEGVPVLLVENGRVREQIIAKERVDISDLLEAARRDHGLERMDQIKYAVLEKNGEISIIPRS